MRNLLAIILYSLTVPLRVILTIIITSIMLICGAITYIVMEDCKFEDYSDLIYDSILFAWNR